jgi:hypothetical protein
MHYGENSKWVIAEVRVVGGQTVLFMAPEILKLRPGFAGEIVWHVYTAGWDLVSVTFPTGSTFTGDPQPDPNRPGCWTTVATNIANGTTNVSNQYTITVRNLASGVTTSFDPVVENEAPPTASQVQPPPE